MCPACYVDLILLRWYDPPPLPSDLIRRCSVVTIPVAIHFELLGTCPHFLVVSHSPSLISFVRWRLCLTESVLWAYQIQLAYWWLLLPWSIWTETTTTSVACSPQYYCLNSLPWCTISPVISLAWGKMILRFYLSTVPPPPMHPLKTVFLPWYLGGWSYHIQ